MTRRPPETRRARCTSCGEAFTSERSPNGRWARTCSLECRARAMRRFAEALLARADELEADIEDAS